MKVTYKGNTYQELVDLTGDKGKTSFDVPESETDLIEFIYKSGYVDEDDWYEGNLHFSIPSWCKLSPETPETVDVLCHTNPEDYETLMYLTSCQWGDGDWLEEDEEVISKRCQEEIEPILPLVKRLYKYSTGIDS